MSITLAQAKALRPGDILIDNHGKRWKVTGMVQTWKRDSSRIRVPLKHGLYSFDVLTEAEFHGDVCDLLTREQDMFGTQQEGQS